MEGIQISVGRADPNPDISVVRINGYIDTTTSSELERVIQTLLREQRFKIIVDLSGVDYISSAGWGIFISEIKNLRSHRGDLKLSNMSENVNEVYELLEFSTILSCAQSITEAVKLFESATPPSESQLPTSAKPASVARPVTTGHTAARPPASAPSRPAPAPSAAPTPATTVPRPAPTPAPVTPAVQPPPPRTPAPAPAPTPVAASHPAPAPVPVPTPEPMAPVVAAPRDPANVPLIERIQEVVRLHPDWGAWKLKGELNRRRGSLPKVSWGEIKAELKFSGLKSKTERFRFARGR